MHHFLNLFILTDALYGSDGSSAHHQEHISQNGGNLSYLYINYKLQPTRSNISWIYLF